VTERLAIDGGTAVRASILPYGRQSLDEADVAAVLGVLRSDWLTTGPKVGEFEEAFAAAVGARYAVAVSSGTAALHAAVFAAGVGPGDEVITTPMTFAATANSVRFQGGTVVFADVQPDTLNIDPVQIKANITPKTKAVIAVDFSGQPADLDDIRDLPGGDGLIAIEDAAHALGATYQTRRVGSLAPLTTFSLHPVKHITTGEGGIVTTDDATLVERLRLFRNHGITTDHRQRENQGFWYYEMVDLGYNYRLTDIQCALGLSQLKKLPGWLMRRREIASRYTESFSGLAEVEVPRVREDRQSAWHLYILRLHLDRLRVGRDHIFRALRAENIGVNVHYIPVPWHPYYQRIGYRRGQWPVAETEYERLISLPIWPGMTDEDVTDVVKAVHKVINAFRK
jgi:perosamine synthetase